jgi:hypothetical protein
VQFKNLFLVIDQIINTLIMIKSTSYLIITLLFFSFYSFSQVGINTENIDSSSILHIESNEKGVLFPVLTLAQRDNINTLAAAAGETVPDGLFIYCSDCCTNGTGALYYYNNTEWKSVDGDCKEVGSFPDCVTVTTALLSTNHLSTSSIPLLFDGIVLNDPQPDEGDLKLHHNSDDTIEFTLSESIPAGGKVVIYWSDEKRPGDLGLLVDLDNAGITSQASIDTFSGVLPNSINVANGPDDDYILTITLAAETDTITVRSFDDDEGDDPYLLEIKVLDDDGNVIPFSCL